MKTKKELDELSNAIGKAIYAYHNAIHQNLAENSGHEYKVQGDDEEEDGQRLSIEGRHGDLVCILVDKIRSTPKKDGVGNNVEVHITEEDYVPKDYWLNINYIGLDDVDYIYDYIIWVE